MIRILSTLLVTAGFTGLSVAQTVTEQGEAGPGAETVAWPWSEVVAIGSSRPQPRVARGDVRDGTSAVTRPARRIRGSRTPCCPG
jgi:hypothetical protein